VDARPHRPQSPALARQRLPMILTAAYLVPDDAAADFATAVGREDEQRQGVELELTGRLACASPCPFRG
jgi:hypothetical protein